MKCKWHTLFLAETRDNGENLYRWTYLERAPGTSNKNDDDYFDLV